MSAQKVLFIGGTGRISWWCVEAAVAKGFEVHVLNRGETGIRPLSPDVTVLKGNVRDRASVAAAIEGMDFDCVVNFVAYDADDVQADLDLFRGRTGQYVFISSASAYQTPPARHSGHRVDAAGRTRSGPIRRTRSPARTNWSKPIAVKATQSPSCGRRIPTTTPRCR